MDGLDWADSANPEQPFVYSNGDPTGYGFHGDFCKLPIDPKVIQLNQQP